MRLVLVVPLVVLLSCSGGPRCELPAEAQPEDVSRPTTVVGTGTPESCTSDAFVAAVAKGGVITFACGAQPHTLVLTETARVFNLQGGAPVPKVVIDGGGKITLSGGGRRRILYQNTCDEALGWATSHCQDQETPLLAVQNLTFVDGDSTGQREEGGGGGAIFVRGGRFKVHGCVFERNRCEASGPDVGGGALRVLSQFQDQPVYVVGSTFGGAEGRGNSAANGGALSSIGVSWTVVDSVFTHNAATGTGMNAGNGGNGGAIYNDGKRMDLALCGTTLTQNRANELGGAVFFVSNDLSGQVALVRSTLRANAENMRQVQPGLYLEAQTKDGTGGLTIEESVIE